MSKRTELPIHEVILKIMYKEDKEKPKGLTAGDVLWKIDNPEITERYVREVLDWLVRENKVTLYLDKYSLDRHEFLDQKAKDDEEDELVTDSTTFYIDPPKKKIRGVRNKIILFSGVLALLYITYLFTQMRRDYELSRDEVHPISIVGRQVAVKKLYLSGEKEQTIDEKFADISYSFSRQNRNNRNMNAEISKLYKTIDSLQKKHQTSLNVIQKQVDQNINYDIKNTNSLLQKIMICNVIFLVIIILTFYRGKI
ncbi:DUF5457 domain-containing protein [Aquimarina algiphila]|uniref:DUF5457 domain-containing protein n=1 Tax=Aquimarina algiphila TaxID=2047982 RepID=UPI00232BAD0B|nr:DUF5457 domain-containing protein [Aquimarina algiphila]